MIFNGFFLYMILILPVLIFILLLSLFRKKSRVYPYVGVFRRENIESNYGYRTRKIVKLLIFSIFFLLLVFLLSGVYDKTEAPKTLYLYVDYSDAMKLNNSDLNFYTDSLMKELSLEETRLFISGREIVSPLKG